MMSVALAKTFRTAMAGRCDARPELAAHADPAGDPRARAALPGRRGPGRELFEPLGWQVTADPWPLDPELPGLGRLALRGPAAAPARIRLADALNHLYVLLPVLDDAKHYWVSPDEVDKLIRAGGGWLAGHPGEDLDHQPLPAAAAGSLTRVALARLAGRGRS